MEAVGDSWQQTSLREAIEGKFCRLLERGLLMQGLLVQGLLVQELLVPGLLGQGLLVRGGITAFLAHIYLAEGEGVHVEQGGVHVVKGGVNLLGPYPKKLMLAI